MDAAKKIISEKFGAGEKLLAQLSDYADLLAKWQSKINLISSSTLPHIWERHFLDSLQLINFVPRETTTIIDLGTGAGLPAVPLACHYNLPVFALESDHKKCAFLEEVKRKLQLTNLNIICARVENAKLNLPTGQGKITITARAFASLSDIFSYTKDLTKNNNISNPTLLLPKGKNANIEIDEAKKIWNFEFETAPSLVENESVILTINNLKLRG
jgi:16S rRNA (guanine527-N7)-methyltransferase